jgi:hypothetical protein
MASKGFTDRPTGKSKKKKFSLTSTLDRGEWSASLPSHFTTGEIVPGTHWIGGWVGSKAGLDAVGKKKVLPLPSIEPWPSSPSLYRLIYPTPESRAGISYNRTRVSNTGPASSFCAILAQILF